MIISGERQISYDDIRARIKRAMSGFRALGLAEAAPVAMMLRNDFALFEVVAASAALGSPVVPINWHLKAEEVRSTLPTTGRRSRSATRICCRRSATADPPSALSLSVRTPPTSARPFYFLGERT